jgi:hypothetical protein
VDNELRNKKKEFEKMLKKLESKKERLTDDNNEIINNVNTSSMNKSFNVRRNNFQFNNNNDNSLDFNELMNTSIDLIT